jgi:tetratricopeptide (TPR) repeat protein
LHPLNRDMEAFLQSTARLNSTDQLRARGLKLVKREEFAEAAEVFRRVVRDLPESPRDRALYGNALARAGRLAQAADEFRTALKMAPADADLHAFLGQVLARSEQRIGAIQSFERAMEIDPHHWSDEEFSVLKGRVSRSVHSWHLHMLADKDRNDAFQAAIEAAVRPDDVVLDIGTGTGLLAMMAARAGAGTVVACEMLPDLAELARLIVQDNGYSAQVAVVGKNSKDLAVGVDLPRPATLLISETFDSLLIGEGALNSFRDARERLLDPAARMIPCGGAIHGQLAMTPRLKPLCPLGQISGFDLGSLRRHCLDKHYYPIQLADEEWAELSDPFEIIRFDFTRDIKNIQQWSLSVRATQSGILQSIIIWIDLQLDAATTLASGPKGQAKHWNTLVFLLSEEREVNAGEEIRIAVDMGGNVLHFDI